MKRKKLERTIANVTFLIIMILVVTENVAVFFNTKFLAVMQELPMSINLLTNEIMLVLPALVMLVIWYVRNMWIEAVDEAPEKVTISDRLMFNKVKISSLLMTILFTLMIMPTIYLCNTITMIFVENEVVGVMDGLIKMGFLPAFFIMAIYGPACEEFVFRGVIYGGLKRACSPCAAVIGSGLLFGLMHLNLNQFAYAFIMGCAMALLVEASGSIIPSFFVHMLINGFTTVEMFALEKLNVDISGTYENMDVSGASMRNMILIAAIVAVVTMTIAGAIIGWIARNEDRINPLSELTKKYPKGTNLRVWSPSYIISSIIAITFIVIGIVMS